MRVCVCVCDGCCHGNKQSQTVKIKQQQARPKFLRTFQSCSNHVSVCFIGSAFSAVAVVTVAAVTAADVALLLLCCSCCLCACYHCAFLLLFVCL